MSIKIMIVDDHSMIREGLAQLLELEDDIRVIAEAGNGEECLKQLEVIKPDVLLLDINMPNMNGLEVLQCIKNKCITIKILILTIHNEIEYLMKAIDIGIDGYVLKDSNFNILKTAINNIYMGEKYIQPSMLPLMKQYYDTLAYNNTMQNNSNILTKREMEVLKLLSAGMLNKEIAYSLEISEKTVKNHVSNIFKKINVSDRTQAAVYAIKNNIVDIF